MNTCTLSMNEAIGEGVKQRGGGKGSTCGLLVLVEMSPRGLGTLAFANRKLFGNFL